MASTPELPGSDAVPLDHQGLPAFAEDGTDLTVIRWFLTLSPGERLRWLDRYLQAIAELRRNRAHP